MTTGSRVPTSLCGCMSYAKVKDRDDNRVVDLDECDQVTQPTNIDEYA